MERTKRSNPQLSTNELMSRLTVLSTLSNRMGLATRMSGQTFGGDRDIYSALGYPKELRFPDYWARYSCQDMAKAIIDRPVNRTWKGKVLIEESSNDQSTPLEAAWEALEDDLGVKSILNRVDKLTGIGKYGVLLMGLNDTSSVEDYSKPVVSSKNLKLLYLKPLSEDSAKINTYETNSTSPRFGLPVLYTITFETTGDTASISVNVHYTRVIHIVDDILESEIEGTPRLNAVFNRLIDLEKIVGGDGEMFWKGARPGYNAKVDEDYAMTPAAQAKLMEDIEEYERNLKRFLVTQGMSLESLAQQLSDPSEHVKVQLQMISASTNIPLRILLGTEEGKLAGEQDSDEWKTYIQTRREEYAETRILRPFIKRLMELNILPPAGKDGYNIKWEDLFSVSEGQKAIVGKDRAAALKEYTTNPIAETIIPPKAFMEFFLGLTPDQIELINEMSDAEIGIEIPVTEEEQAALIEPITTRRKQSNVTNQ